MKIEDIEVGDSLKGQVKEDLEYPFEGTVEKKYENSVILDITESDPRDKQNVAELNNKIVVSIKNLKKA